MRIIKGINNWEGSGTPDLAVTIGNFDGVHLGHQKIMKRLAEVAQKKGLESMVITFDPHPTKVLFPDRDLKLLTTTEQKLKLIEKTGVSAVLIIPFDKEFSRMPAGDFIKDILVRKLKVKHVIIGHNYRFGKGKTGNTQMLRNYGRRYGYSLNVVRNMKIGGFTVSSTRIRQLLHWGRVCEASTLLGRPYSIHGEVVKGAGRGGSILDTPTANIATPQELMPREGVYAVRVRMGDRLYDGVANIGKNPTFDGKRMSYEVHLFGYSGNLLGRELTVYFIDRLRGEKRFSSPEELKEQIIKDIDIAKMILKEYRVDIDP